MQIKPEDIKVKIPDISFDNTSEIDVTSYEECVIQENAYDIVNMALKIKEKNSNIFVVGPVGTGRRDMIKNLLTKVALKEKIPPDIVYAYNFENAKKPKMLKFPHGKAKEFKKKLEFLVESSFQALKNGMQSNEYLEKMTELEKEYMNKRKQLWTELKEKAKELNYVIEFTNGGIVSLPIIEGKKITSEEYEKLPEEKQKEFEENSPKLRILIENIMNKIATLDKKYREQLKNMQKYWASFSINKIFESIESEYEKYSDIIDYLKSLKNDISINFVEITSENEDAIKYFKKKYSINIVIDNYYLQGAPVIEELSPTYSSLVGRVEYYSNMGALQTDFSMIKSGSFYKANGGYLILDAEKVLRKPFVWEAIKRTLLLEQIKIENVESAEGYSNIQTLEPEPLPFNFKIILIGEEWIYDMLSVYDNDFKKFFTIKAQFEYENQIDEFSINKFSTFVAKIVKEKNIQHLTKKAVIELLKYSCRINSNNKKFSLKYGDIKNLIIESTYFAEKYDHRPYTNSEDIKEAIDHREKMFSFHKRHFFEMIKDNIYKLDVQGKKIGQLNGLTVIQTVDYTFGHPVKITAKFYKSDGENIIDIHRATEMSGKIHKKSTFIFENFFKSKFSNFLKNGFTASLNFEQVYSMIDGDSATLAETIALMSVIGNIPIKQNIAITGSMNQNGEVQPVGGLIQKIEGFYDICKILGFNGKQGVIIPYQNINDLVLKEELMKDLEDEKFKIWTVKNLDEAVEILSDLKAGKETKAHHFTKNSFYYNVAEGLKKLTPKETKKKHKK